MQVNIQSVSFYDFPKILYWIKLKFTLQSNISFKRQPYKIVKHTQTIRRQIADELLECAWTFSGVGGWRDIINMERSTLSDFTIDFMTVHKKCFLRIWFHLLKKSLMENFIFEDIIATSELVLFLLVLQYSSNVHRVFSWNFSERALRRNI